MIVGSPQNRRLLLVHAHPDDETLTTGGTIARYVAAGAEVTVVTCTLGEEGEVIPSELAELGAEAADQLGGYRAGELRAACAALGLSRHYYLGGIGRWRDSGMAEAPSAEHPRAFVAGTVEEQAEQLQSILDEVSPEVVVGYDAHGGYGHPDHIRAHEITMAATARVGSVRRVFHTVVPETPLRVGLERLRERPALPFTVPKPDALPTVPDARAHTAIDITEHLEKKFAALRAHRTQVSVWQPQRPDPLSWAFALSNGIALPNVDAEHFELVRGAGDDVAADLFGGLP